jgi:hypothetical protein
MKDKLTSTQHSDNNRTAVSFLKKIRLQLTNCCAPAVQHIFHRKMAHSFTNNLSLVYTSHYRNISAYKFSNAHQKLKKEQTNAAVEI